MTLQISEVVAQAYEPQDTYNFASPVEANGALHIVDQAGRILRAGRTPGAAGLGPFDEILGLGDTPPGVTAQGNRAILNVSSGVPGTLDVAFTSTTLPAGATAALPLPAVPAGTDDPYAGRGYQLVYRYQQSGDGTLSSPELLGAFEARDGGHRGGGMLTLPDGRVLLATGDYLPFGLDGFSAPQQSDVSPSKILLIDGDSGSVSVAAKGVRNGQQLALSDVAGEPYLAFADIGSTAAEEINTVPLAQLLDTTRVENFGWGRNPDDGLAREGIYTIDEGRAGSGANTSVTGLAPEPDTGFLKPFAQYGREDERFAAVSGPIVAQSAFETLTSVFGDLPTGKVFATTEALSSGLSPVLGVELRDTAGAVVTLFDLAGGARPDPRFFVWQDGSAGVLLERTGALYRLQELRPVPVPASLGLLTIAVLCVGALRAASGRRS